MQGGRIWMLNFLRTASKSQPQRWCSGRILSKLVDGPSARHSPAARSPEVHPYPAFQKAQAVSTQQNAPSWAFLALPPTPCSCQGAGRLSCCSPCTNDLTNIVSPIPPSSTLYRNQYIDKHSCNRKITQHLSGPSVFPSNLAVYITLHFGANRASE